MSVRVIHKVTTEAIGGIVAIPAGAKILSLQIQYGVPTIWYEFDASAREKLEYRVNAIGTGSVFDDYLGDYLGTLQYDGGRLVLHYYLNFTGERLAI